MTLEQYAQIGEVVASIAVIASLLYVARQMQQNTDMMRVSTAQHFVDFNMRLCGPIAADRELAELWVKGESEFDTLDAVDRRRIVLFEWQAITGWYNYYNLYQQKLLSEAKWIEVSSVFEIIGRRQSVREAWEAFKIGYDKPFQDFMAQYLES